MVTVYHSFVIEQRLQGTVFWMLANILKARIDIPWHPCRCYLLYLMYLHKYHLVYHKLKLCLFIGYVNHGRKADYRLHVW